MIFYRTQLIVSLLLVFLLPIAAQSQAVLPDTPATEQWYSSYDTSLTTRIYLSQKYLATRIKKEGMPTLRYLPNSKLALGLGASYGWFTLNLSAAMGFLKPKEDERGESKALDLQGHFYSQKAVIDLFASFYDGYYLAPEGRGNTSGNYYVRPDIESWQLGFAGYYSLNWKKFSYRAAFLQTAWQHKSAGSVLVGFELANGQTKGDSALVPAIYAKDPFALEVNRARYFALGPGIGYAYTLVFAKHWFVSGAVTGALAGKWFKETSLQQIREKTFSLKPNMSYKAALGYNNDRYGVNLTWTHNSIYAKGGLGNYAISAGNIRLHFAWRFAGSKKFRDYVDFLQKPLF